MGSGGALVEGVEVDGEGAVGFLGGGDGGEGFFGRSADDLSEDVEAAFVTGADELVFFIIPGGDAAFVGAFGSDGQDGAAFVGQDDAVLGHEFGVDGAGGKVLGGADADGAGDDLGVIFGALAAGG